MSTLVNCPKCRIEIESDSYYCDQCGVELHICPQCHVFGKGKRCTQCGQPLVSAKESSPAHVAPSPTVSASFDPTATSHSPAPSSAIPVSSPAPEAEKTMRPEVPAAPAPACLVCSAAGIRLELRDGAVIGRRQGDYVSAFASQGYVSGTHARLQKNAAGKWDIVDLDSTNGTFVNDKRLSPNAPVEFHTGDVVRIATLDFKVE